MAKLKLSEARLKAYGKLWNSMPGKAVKVIPSFNVCSYC
jgi:hypothetical protein